MAARGELDSMTTLSVVLVFGGATGVGWAVAGLGGAFVGAVVGAVAGVVTTHRRTVGRRPGKLDGAAPDLSQLPPSGALAVMSATVGEGLDGADAFRSELLTELEAIEREAKNDAPTAIARLAELQRRYPRSPAVRAEMARNKLAAHGPDEAMVALRDAIALALDGGMNPKAAQLYTEFKEHREQIELDAHHLQRLARVLEHRGQPDDARWCRDRAQSP